MTEEVLSEYAETLALLTMAGMAQGIIFGVAVLAVLAILDIFKSTTKI